MKGQLGKLYRVKKMMAAVVVILVAVLLGAFPALAAIPPQGYWTVGEYEPMESVWLQWPDYRDDTLVMYDPATGLYHAPEEWVEVFVEIARELRTEGRVDVIVLDAEGEANAIDALTAGQAPTDNIFFHQMPYDHPWALDNFGPFVAKDGELHVLDFGFNAWNVPEWEPYELDDMVPQQVAALLGIGFTEVTYVDPTDGVTKPFIFEGGAFECSGEGTIVASWSVAVNRNPNLDQPQATQIFKEITGAHTVIWIENSLAEEGGLPYGWGAEDHTDGYLKFYAPGKVAVLRTAYAQQSPMVLEAIEKLEAAGWTIDEFRADWTFMNHTVYGNKVLCGYGQYPPMQLRLDDMYIVAYTAPRVQKGIMELQKLYPDKEIVVLDISVLVVNGGGIHCATRQQPSVP